MVCHEQIYEHDVLGLKIFIKDLDEKINLWPSVCTSYTYSRRHVFPSLSSPRLCMHVICLLIVSWFPLNFRDQTKTRDIVERERERERMMSAAGNGQVTVPPGFRFHPTDEELLYYYLRKKVSYEAIDLDVIREVDLNKLEPWDLKGNNYITSLSSSSSVIAS